MPLTPTEGIQEVGRGHGWDGDAGWDRNEGWDGEWDRDVGWDRDREWDGDVGETEMGVGRGQGVGRERRVGRGHRWDGDAGWDGDMGGTGTQGGTRTGVGRKETRVAQGGGVERAVSRWPRTRAVFPLHRVTVPGQVFTPAPKSQDLENGTGPAVVPEGDTWPPDVPSISNKDGGGAHP